jgi:chromosome segregation ATPase
LWCASLQLSGGAELRRQLEVQLADATTANSALQAQLDRANVNVETLTARMAELSSQLANSSEMGGSLRVQNSELMSELAFLRCEETESSSLATTIGNAYPVSLACCLGLSVTLQLPESACVKLGGCQHN